MDNIISNVNSIYTNGTYASGTGNSLEDKINNKIDIIKIFFVIILSFYKYKYFCRLLSYIRFSR